ncbi:exocyst complex component EXO70E2-like [Actinidia eriantha]|uniref:exocyst complex component EXO70E2-like n=1 Tax=Actinidia eriantha TaxID=165200 RepID=UPI0025833A10|nr:exocyst complex component EXO70E2-like [Actinidia eriantha]
MIWDWSSEEAEEHVEAVNEARSLMENLESLCFNRESVENELLWRARDVLHMAMVRLEEEFRQILVQYGQPFESGDISCGSSDAFSFEDDSSEDMLQSISSSSEESIIDLVPPAVIPDLQCIANLMFDSNYVWECTDAIISVRKDALYDCLVILEVENLRIEDMPAMESATFDNKIKRCTWAMKNFLRVYLSSEKWLSDQIFGDLDSISSICFAEASKASMLQLLRLGEAVAYGPRPPETMFRFLDMYELLADLSPKIDAWYANETGFDVRTEWEDILRKVRNCVKQTFLELHNSLASHISTNPFAGGGIYHLTSGYIMNHIRALTSYADTLNLLLEDPNSASGSASCCVSPMALHISSLMSDLECKLWYIAKMYKVDYSLLYFFLMNHTHYIAKGVIGSDLRSILGDEWICEQSRKLQQVAMCYQSAAWSRVLSSLMCASYENSGSRSKSTLRTLVKVRLHMFNHHFREIYKCQTGWFIAHSELRQDLLMSVSDMVIPAYRSFLQRYGDHIRAKNVTYTPEDLENYLLDLFEGSPRSLPEELSERESIEEFGISLPNQKIKLCVIYNTTKTFGIVFSFFCQ